MELMKNAQKALKMPIYRIKLLKLPTSGHLDQSDQIELMKNSQKGLKKANLMSKMARMS